MTLEELRQMEALANNLGRALPANYPEAFNVARAPGAIHEAMDSALELAKMEAVAEYINTQQEDQQDRKTLAKMEGPMKICKRRLEATGALEKQLINITVKYQIEEAAKAAGAINPSLVADYIEKTAELKQSVEDDGKVKAFVDGWPVSSFIKNMTFVEDTRHLFDARIATTKSEDSQSYKGENPWAKETFNLTKQGEIYRRDPILAEKLRKVGEPMRSSSASNPWKDGALSLTEQGRILQVDPNTARRMIVEAGKTPQAYGL